MLLDEPVEEFEIDPGAVALPEEDRSEPVLVSGPYLVEFDEVAPLDPARGVYEPDDIEEYPEPPHRPKPLGLVGSFGMHLLPLLVLLGLASSTPAASGGAIPIRFVLQQSAPETPSADTEASQAAQSPPPQAVQPPLTPPKPAESKPKVQQATMTPPLPPKPLASAPSPAPAAQATAKPRNEMQLASAATTMRQIDPQLRPIVRAAAPAGLNSTGPYLAYLVNLTAKHLDMLPVSVVGGRHGKTVIGVRVMDDGTIANTRIASSSSYPDIDARIEQMVVAVGHFPPLPPALRGQNVELNLNLNFPEVFQQ